MWNGCVKVESGRVLNLTFLWVARAQSTRETNSFVCLQALFWGGGGWEHPHLSGVQSPQSGSGTPTFASITPTLCSSSGDKPLSPDFSLPHPPTQYLPITWRKLPCIVAHTQSNGCVMKSTGELWSVIMRDKSANRERNVYSKMTLSTKAESDTTN